MVRILPQRFCSDLVSLAVQPSDGPVIPGTRDPSDPAGVTMAVLFQPGESVAKARSVAENTERRPILHRNDHGDPGRVIQSPPVSSRAAGCRFPQRAGY